MFFSAAAEDCCNFCTILILFVFTDANQTPDPETCTYTLIMSSVDFDSCVDSSTFRDAWHFSCGEWKGYNCFRYPGYSEPDLAQVRQNCPLTCNACPKQTFVRQVPNRKPEETFEMGKCSTTVQGNCSSHGVYTIQDSTTGHQVALGTCCGDRITNSIEDVQHVCSYAPAVGNNTSTDHQAPTAAPTAAPTQDYTMVHWASNNVSSFFATPFIIPCTTSSSLSVSATLSASPTLDSLKHTSPLLPSALYGASLTFGVTRLVIKPTAHSLRNLF